MTDKEVKELKNEPVKEKEPDNNVEPQQLQGQEEEVKIIQVPGDLIVRVFYTCENEGCAQTWQATTRSCPLHCPFCGGPIAISMLLVQNRYTDEQIAERQARVLAAQQAAAQAALAAQAAAAQQQAHVPNAGKPVMRPIQRVPPKQG